MVLEHLFPESWLERKSYYAFLLGAGYSIIGIILAKFLFAADPAIPAVAFTSILLLPSLYIMFSIEEREQVTGKGHGLRVFWKENGDFFRVFLFLFLGILLVYSFGAIFLDGFAVNSLFREQLAMRNLDGFGAVGNAVANHSSAQLFWQLLQNNFLVMAACFVVALLAGDGAIFLIVWNASVWGTIFGVTARNAAVFTQGDPFLYFAQILLTVFPHVIFEASAYILAAIAGGLISKAALTEGLDGKKFGIAFSDNAFILFLACVCLLIGAGIETLVLTNVQSYSELISWSLKALR